MFVVVEKMRGDGSKWIGKGVSKNLSAPKIARLRSFKNV